MQSLLEEGLSLDFPNQGEIRPGIIATIRDNEILVSIGTKSEGVISGRELEQIPAEERAAFVVGQEIPVFVIAPEDPNGNVVLSYVRAREEKDWDEVDALLESGASYDSKVDRLQQRRSDRARRAPARFCARLADQPAAPPCQR